MAESRDHPFQFTLAGLLRLTFIVAAACSASCAMYQWQAGSVLLFLVTMFWPSILVMIGLSLPRDAGRGKFLTLLTIILLAGSVSASQAWAHVPVLLGLAALAVVAWLPQVAIIWLVWRDIQDSRICR